MPRNCSRCTPNRWGKCQNGCDCASCVDPKVASDNARVQSGTVIAAHASTWGGRPLDDDDRGGNWEWSCTTCGRPGGTTRGGTQPRSQWHREIKRP